MKLHEKINWPKTYWQCKKLMENDLLILFQNPTFFQMNMQIFMLIFFSNNRKITLKMYGFLNLLKGDRERVFLSQII